MSSERTIRVLVDSCATNRFALLNVDPIKALAGTRFEVAITPGLETEYRQALAHRSVEPHIKTMLRRLLEGGAPPWDRAAGHAGLILWPDLERAWRGGETLAAFLSSRAAALDSAAATFPQQSSNGA